MKTKVVVAVIAITIALVSEYIPIEISIGIYAIVGATFGAFFIKVNRWAREGILSVVGGVIVAVFADQVLPPLIDSAVESLDGILVVMLKSIPYILKAGMLWGAIVGSMEKLGRITWD